ncbi:hypothetical protein [Acinetobacter sp. ANC 3813]|uniref:hypothetical protein n=1 Tax=Acinetobacter sp. ANC 3813 TaxID=1977873 RepID=UPI000A336D90|nr:hypothetical protein [Acinetobacter sp. ANC 3813]OTG91476.1 hypothetical protein B9T34_03995 [Acinetobacter sp. ANC 3813]
MKQHNSIGYIKHFLGQNHQHQSYTHDHHAVPSVPNVTEFSTVLSGTADARSWVIISTDEESFRVKVDAQGHWSIDNPIQTGGVATIYSINSHGVRSEDIQIAKVVLAPNTPEIIERNEYLSGTADPGNTVIATHNGQEYTAIADENGYWSMLNPLISTGSMAIVAVNEAGVRSDELVIAKIIMLQAPVIQENDEVLSGTADPHSIIVIKANDLEYRVIADEAGHWSIDNPIANGGTAELYAMDQYGSKSGTIGIAKMVEQPIPPSVPEITESDAVLAGTADPYSIIVIKANNLEYRVIADETGHWSIDNPIAKGGTAELYALNQQGSTSETIAIAKLVQLPLPSTPIVTESDAVLAGTADPHSIIIIKANDLEYRVIANDAGHWSIDNPIANGGVLSIVAQNQTGQQSLEIMLAIPLVPVEPEAPEYAISPPIILVNDEMLEGQSSPNLKIVIKANDQVYETTSNADGHWQIDNPIKNGGFAVIYAENSAGKHSDEISIAKIAVMPLATDNDLSDVLTAYADVQAMPDHPSLAGDAQLPIDVDSLLSANSLNDAQNVWLDPNAAQDADTLMFQQSMQDLSNSFNYPVIELDTVQPATQWVA